MRDLSKKSTIREKIWDLRTEIGKTCNGKLLAIEVTKPVIWELQRELNESEAGKYVNWYVNDAGNLTIFDIELKPVNSRGQKLW